MRLLVIALIILLGSLFGIMHFTEGARLLATLQAGLWYWVTAAVVGQVLVIVNRAGLYHASIASLTCLKDLRDLLFWF